MIDPGRPSEVVIEIGPVADPAPVPVGRLHHDRGPLRFEYDPQGKNTQFLDSTGERHLDAHALFTHYDLCKHYSQRVRFGVLRCRSVLAPDLYAAEATNVVWKRHALAGEPLVACEEALAAALELPDTLVPLADLSREAFALARLGQCAAYDMFYVALARRHDAVLLTLDSKLLQFCRRQGVRSG